MELHLSLNYIIVKINNNSSEQLIYFIKTILYHSHKERETTFQCNIKLARKPRKQIFVLDQQICKTELYILDISVLTHFKQQQC